jgi:hypothetical protein
VTEFALAGSEAGLVEFGEIDEEEEKKEVWIVESSGVLVVEG